MSGAHDVARDAAKSLLQILRMEQRNEMDENRNAVLILEYDEEIETIAEYLGVEEEK